VNVISTVIIQNISIHRIIEQTPSNNFMKNYVGMILS